MRIKETTSELRRINCLSQLWSKKEADEARRDFLSHSSNPKLDRRRLSSLSRATERESVINESLVKLMPWAEETFKTLPQCLQEWVTDSLEDMLPGRIHNMLFWGNVESALEARDFALKLQGYPELKSAYFKTSTKTERVGDVMTSERERFITQHADNLRVGISSGSTEKLIEKYLAVLDAPRDLARPELP